VAEFPERKLLPPDGVYAARVEWPGGVAGGMLNQGGKPTFGDTRRTLEVHLFGVDEELYGEWVRVEWVERLRDVKRFGGVEELKAQLQRDRTAALDALARHRPMIDHNRASHA
jgi:riboflavin kinase/FMN adenylyltransferase